MTQLSYTLENYLEAIYELSRNNKTGARISDIAKRMHVSKASTNSAMNSLSEKGLIINEKYGKIFLTDKGYELSKSTSIKHQIIKEFFCDILGINMITANDDACKIEHVISGDSVAAMKKYMQQQKK